MKSSELHLFPVIPNAAILGVWQTKADENDWNSLYMVEHLYKTLSISPFRSHIGRPRFHSSLKERWNTGNEKNENILGQAGRWTMNSQHVLIMETTEVFK